MNPVGDDVGQAEELQGRLVRDDGVGRPAKPGGDDLFVRCRGVVAQAIQPPGDAQEAAGPRMMGQQRRAEAMILRLGGREVPGLRAGRLEETLVIRPRLVVHNLNCMLVLHFGTVDPDQSAMARHGRPPVTAVTPSPLARCASGGCGIVRRFDGCPSTSERYVLGAAATAPVRSR